MTRRIPRIYTRTGDRGETGLVGGARVPKDSPRLEAYGSLDELNCFIGAALAEIGASPRAAAAAPVPSFQELAALLAGIQHRLFDLGAYLATPPAKQKPGTPGVGASEVELLEKTMDRWGEGLPPLAGFILPGGGKAGAWLHLSRAVCRRVERRVLALYRQEPLDPVVLAYLNRLSDFFFVAARLAAQLAGEAETPWKPSVPAAPQN
ncbi:MAG: cob(I)yrinic acid a,c-diamide adenosyltransferase [Planctomycetes bacterium]|nr:cob(I)yrinic acid a,c-diamide adenosyltransferase [Planctomycetota bacterium]